MIDVWFQVPGEHDVIYNINPCGSLKDMGDECKGSVVCHVKGKKHTNFGDLKPVTFVPEGDDFKMIHSGGACSSSPSECLPDKYITAFYVVKICI